MAVKRGYTGHSYDAETGLTYMLARSYDPAVGRFLMPDPVGSGDDMNVYGYVKGDPINATDPTGMLMHALHSRADIDPCGCDGQTIDATDATLGDTGTGSAFKTMADGLTGSSHFDGSALNAGTMSFSAMTAAHSNADKSIGATTSENIYRPTNGGLDITLHATVSKAESDKYAGINWTQDVQSSPDINGYRSVNPSWQPDGQSGALPFYYNQKQEPIFSTRNSDGSTSSIFVDHPRRPTNNLPISWSARLSLVGRNSSGTYNVISSFTYGYHTDMYGNTTLQPFVQTK